MLFNSLAYFAFVIAVFLLYWKLNNRLRLQNIFVILVSYLFYACWDWRFLLLIIASSATDFIVGQKLGIVQKPTSRKLLLVTSLVVNLGLLAFFKYFNFFVESASVFLQTIGLETSLSSLSIILPVGISFYTFQTLSYTIDVYRGKLQPTKSWIEFFAFVGFFPQLVAGPIERASNLLPQFATTRKFNAQFAITGMRLILWGLFKKMVIADRLAIIVEALYADPASCNSWMAALAGIAFAYQVYCDFSGYSDIAIGTARLMGFKLMRNFQTPFLSSSQTELWKRWHISLSTWFRDYLYIPLGGNRVSILQWSGIILFTFTVSGLWHGADFHYVIWGFACGVPLVVERVFRIKSIGIIPNFLLFSFLLIIFRSTGLTNAFIMYQRLFALDFALPLEIHPLLQSIHTLIYTSATWLLFVIAEMVMGKSDFDASLSKIPALFRWSIYYILIALIMLFGVLDNAPSFIYFQF